MISATILILATIIISFYSIKNDFLKYSFNLWPNRIVEIWRLFTYSFIHNDKYHLIWNVLFYLIGFLGFYQKFSNYEFIKFYFINSFICIIPYIILNFKNKYSTLSGNSGVNFSILYGFIILEPNLVLFGCSINLYLFGIFYFILSYIDSLINKKISFITHLTGLLSGIFYVKYLM
jgi:rhomboid protease GluP